MAALHASFLAWTEEPQRRNLNGVDMGQVILTLRDTLPADAVITNGAGNFATWVHRYYRFRRFGTQLAPTSGSMGYGFPAALAAAALDRTRPAICVAGDGDFMMTGQEFATAVQYDLPVIAIIADNGMYGTIRMHQEREYPGRVSGTGLRNPDFAMLARAFGGHGERVETTADFAPAFARARSSGKPAIIHCLVDPEAITPATTLSALREKALAGRGQPKR
jgi:acetolactate synthase-1/2/3 large subunit